jgi:pSer/pThr/pTyr-binding forkhead associated (FHA) protein
MPSRLVPLNPNAAQAILLQRPVLLVGRHSDCDLRLDLPAISRRHCCLALAYDRVVVRDLGSRNGLRVNGLRVEECQLNPGDEVAIGPLIYRVEDTETAAAAAKEASTPVVPTPVATPERLPTFTMSASDSDEDLIPLDT